jgi:hypothetical protein
MRQSDTLSPRLYVQVVVSRFHPRRPKKTILRAEPITSATTEYLDSDSSEPGLLSSSIVETIVICITFDSVLTVPNIAIVNTVVAVLLLYLQIISSVTAIGLRKGEVRTRYIGESKSILLTAE